MRLCPSMPAEVQDEVSEHETGGGKIIWVWKAKGSVTYTSWRGWVMESAAARLLPQRLRSPFQAPTPTEDQECHQRVCRRPRSAVSHKQVLRQHMCLVGRLMEVSAVPYGNKALEKWSNEDSVILQRY